MKIIIYRHAKPIVSENEIIKGIDYLNKIIFEEIKRESI